MRNEILLVAALLAAPTVIAQEKKGAEKKPADAGMQMPDPKAPEHDVLKNLAGDWDYTFKSPGMPGVKDMDKPMETTGTEHVDLVCNGLWAKSVINGTMMGQPFQGVWLIGYDRFAKKYISVWVDSTGPESCAYDGTWDAKSRTYTWKGKCSMGDTRMTVVFKDNDNSVQTSWMTPPGGKEFQCMEVTRKRASKPAPAIAVNATMKAPSNEMVPLFHTVGNWTATVKSAASGARPASEDKGTEKATPICNGNWIWCDFQCTFGGQPFEGHGISGYDSAEKKYVSYWIDTMVGTLMKTAGNPDPAKKEIILDGTGTNPMGESEKVHQVLSIPDANSRILNMTFKSPSANEQMEIIYKKS
jgi:hypothetical protein